MCQKKGATVGCFVKGCSQKYHYLCGVEAGQQSISSIIYIKNFMKYIFSKLKMMMNILNLLIIFSSSK